MALLQTPVQEHTVLSPRKGWQAAMSPPQLSTIALGRFPSDERSTVMHTHLLGG